MATFFHLKRTKRQTTFTLLYFYHFVFWSDLFSNFCNFLPGLHPFWLEVPKLALMTTLVDSAHLLRGWLLAILWYRYTLDSGYPPKYYVLLKIFYDFALFSDMEQEPYLAVWFPDSFEYAAIGDRHPALKRKKNGEVTVLYGRRKHRGIVVGQSGKSLPNQYSHY